MRPALWMSNRIAVTRRSRYNSRALAGATQSGLAACLRDSSAPRARELSYAISLWLQEEWENVYERNNFRIVPSW